MSQRLTTITTRTGDDGYTSLGDGQRLSKHHLRIQALGEVDELNSHLGVWRSQQLPDDIDTLLAQIQNHLFDLGAELAVPGYYTLQAQQVELLEQHIQDYNTMLPPLKEFILPGGCAAAAHAHVCRSISRRAERALVAVADTDPGISRHSLHYLNRLSDLCFVLARILNKRQNHADVLWQPAPPAP